MLGAGEDDIPNKLKPDVYAFNLVTVGEKTVIPDGVTIGKEHCHSRRKTEPLKITRITPLARWRNFDKGR